MRGRPRKETRRALPEFATRHSFAKTNNRAQPEKKPGLPRFEHYPTESDCETHSNLTENPKNYFMPKCSLIFHANRIETRNSTKPMNINFQIRPLPCRRASCPVWHWENQSKSNQQRGNQG